MGGSDLVIPTDPVWLSLFGIIGVFAFTAQVNAPKMPPNLRPSQIALISSS